jgi:hypothetical protein
MGRLLYASFGNSNPFESRFIALMMEAVRTSETSVHSNETTRRYITEGCSVRHLCCLCICAMRSVTLQSWSVFRRSKFSALKCPRAVDCFCKVANRGWKQWVAGGVSLSLSLTRIFHSLCNASMRRELTGGLPSSVTLTGAQSWVKVTRQMLAGEREGSLGSPAAQQFVVMPGAAM